MRAVLTKEMRKQIREEFSNPTFTFKVTAVNELSIGETCIAFTTLFEGNFQAYFETHSGKLKSLLKISQCGKDTTHENPASAYKVKP